MYEHFFICPYCWEKISMLLDPDLSNEEYVEDCEVCCRPIVIIQSCDEFKLSHFKASLIEGN
jgi:hypothetical protein